MFIGSHGLRAGWSILIAVIIYRLCTPILGSLAIGIYPGLENFDFTPTAAFFQELVPLLAMIAAGFVVSRIEQHSIFAYNLTGPQPALRFISGLAAGFAGLSALVGTLAMGGWLHFGPVALSGIQILNFGALWALVFLLVGCVEEGIFRCYLQFTLERGINFWWALASRRASFAPTCFCDPEEIQASLHSSGWTHRGCSKATLPGAFMPQPFWDSSPACCST